MKTQFLSTAAIVGLVSAVALTSAPAFAAAYMKLGDIKGEIAAAPKTAAARAAGGWIEIDSYSFGAVGSRTCTGQAGPGQISAGGQRSALPRPGANRLPKVSLQVERPGGGTLGVVLENVLITSATGSAPDKPTETLTLNYTKVSWSHSACSAGMLLPAIQKVREATTR